MACLAAIMAISFASPALPIVGGSGGQGLITGGVLLPILSLCTLTFQLISLFADLVDEGININGL
jgi:hypothetical protein